MISTLKCFVMTRKLTFSLGAIFGVITALVATTSCSDEQIKEEGVGEATVMFEGLKVKLREGHDAAELSMSQADYETVLYTTSKRLKSQSDMNSYSFEVLDSLSRKVAKSYPHNDSVDYERIKAEFVGLSDRQINDNMGTIQRYYSMLMTYDLIKEVAKCEKGASPEKVDRLKSSYFGTDLNSKEFWVLARNPFLIPAAKSAAKSAISYTDKHFAKYVKYQDVADAFRHSLWNALLCKAAAPHKNQPSECMRFAKELSDAHEYGASKPTALSEAMWTIDKGMDLHNNGIGRDYFATVASSYKPHWYSFRYVKCPSESTLANDILSMYIPKAVKVASTAQIDASKAKLVYLK